MLSLVSGVICLDENGIVFVELQIVVIGILVGEFDGLQLIVLINGVSCELYIYYVDNLECVVEVIVVDGFSMLGIIEFLVIDIMVIIYGYMVYLEGMVGVFDCVDNCVKVIL